MAERFSPEQIAEFKECFSLYDRDDDGLISMDQLKLVMRSLGQCPTQSELNAMVTKSGKSKVNFPQFLDLMYTNIVRSNSYASDIAQAFVAYDNKRTGYITIKDLRHIMMRTGERMTTAEFDYMLYQAGINNKTSKVRYDELAKVFDHV